MTALIAALRAQPDSAARVSDPAEVDRKYRYWRFRILSASMVGYAIYYFVRSNTAVAIPRMEEALHYSHAQVGAILSVGGVVYGVSKFINGFLGDRSNPRYFMAIGLLLSASMNVGFGMSSALGTLTAFWFLNNWAQGMGFPPCARNMGYWFSPRERGTTFGIWHIGHTAGAALTSILTGLIIKYTGNWRLCFFIPAGIAVAGSVMLLIRLRDTPGSLGLPPVEVYKGEESPTELAQEVDAGEPYWRVAVRNVLLNPFLWVISFANLLVYILRLATLNWGPTYLEKWKHVPQFTSAALHSGNEFSGMIGALLAGYLADRYFRGRAGRVCVIAMVLMAAVVYLFWMTPPSRTWLLAPLYLAMGFLVYVPQMLIAAMAMNLATKRAAAAAVGLTGIVGYLSNIVSGWGIGAIADRHDWDAAFKLMIGCAAATAALMAVTWNVGAHPKLEKAQTPATAAPAPAQPAARAS
jgi:OPA family glycerol-3-phosphate transporter-like MFS transporter/OPA family sugar phosphate sensor protein UhpC-like MFS transporter